MVLSVVIPTYNNAGMLPEVLGALAGQTLPLEQFEVIVIDDGSTDTTGEVVSKLDLPPNLHFFRETNAGAAATRNRGAKLARADILLFLDSDVIADERLLEEHVAYHDRHDAVLLVGRTVVPVFTENDVFLRVMGRTLLAFEPSQQDTVLSYQEAISRNLSMKREVFLRIGGFDESFPDSGYEDVEFAYRAVSQGVQVHYSPTASGVHDHKVTLEQMGEHIYKYQQSAALMIKKHPGVGNDIKHLRDKLPVRWLSDSPSLVARKLARRALSLRSTQRCLRGIIRVVEQKRPNSRLLPVLYWQVLGGYLYYGFRTGCQRYGVHNA